jgi:hypothetical protein
MPNKQNRGRKAKANLGVGRKSTFDKTEADRYRIPVPGAGSFQLPGKFEVERLWLEWHPRAGAEPIDRPFFVGKKGITDVVAILGDGGFKLPRGGKSIVCDERTFIANCGGDIHLWEMSIKETTVESPVTITPLPSPPVATSRVVGRHSTVPVTGNSGRHRAGTLAIQSSGDEEE